MTEDKKTEPKTETKEKTPEEVKKEKNQADTKKVSDFLSENNLDISSQLFIVLGNGELVPIRGLTAQALVVEKETDGRVEPPQPDTGKSAQ